MTSASRSSVGAIATGTAVNDDAAGPCASDRGHGSGAALRLAVEERPVVERSAVQVVGPAELPELGVGNVAQRHADGAQLRRPRPEIGKGVSVPQVDHRADAVRQERRPAPRGQAAEIVRANEGAAADRVAVGGVEPAEVADVEAAVPVQVSYGVTRPPTIRRATPRTRGTGAASSRTRRSN